MSTIKDYAEQLSDVLLKIEDLKVEATAICDAAKDAGVDVKALRKVAREMVTDSAKLAKRYESEHQIDLFRQEVGIFQAKGLAETEKAYWARRSDGDRKVKRAAKELDAMIGTDLAGSHERDLKAIRKWSASREAAE